MQLSKKDRHESRRTGAACEKSQEVPEDIQGAALPRSRLSSFVTAGRKMGMGSRRLGRHLQREAALLKEDNKQNRVPHPRKKSLERRGILATPREASAAAGALPSGCSRTDCEGR